ncbi:hypothetical protein ACGFIV_18375 [Sphaerisporangium sp. NPDC049003]|uniref:hypothetical protein n=1 Tax=Sphaerisporangium sp. NPDC049003 TaxID=3364517 RepID=UPI00372219D7
MNPRSDDPTPCESFAAIQRIRYSVWSVGLSLMLLATSVRPWVRSAEPSAGTVLSLWDLPTSDLRIISENGTSAFGMLVLALSLAMVTALNPVRPMILGTLLSAILSFLNLMWLHQALPRPHSRFPWSTAWVTPGSAPTAALVETLALIIGLALVAVADSSDERDVIQQTSPDPAEQSGTSAWSPYPTHRLAQAARGMVLVLLLFFAGTLPWMRFRHHLRDGSDTIRHLSLWDLSDASISDKVTTAGQVTLTLLVASCLLVLLAAAEPHRMVAACGAMSLCLTVASVIRLCFMATDLHRRYPAVELTALPGLVLTVALLLVSTTVLVGPSLCRRLRTTARRPYAERHPV